MVQNNTVNIVTMVVLVTASCALAGAPTAGNVFATAPVGGQAYITLAGHDTETMEWNLEHIITQAPAKGSVAYQMPGLYPQASFLVVYTNSSGAPGDRDTFRYKVRDAEGLESGEATVTVAIGSNAAPTAVDMSVTVVEGAVAQDIYLEAGDDFDAQDALTYLIVSPPAHGTLEDVTSPTYYHKRYSPSAGFVGTDTFTFKACDSGGLESGEATVTVTVQANTPPAANDVAVRLTEGYVDLLITMSGTDAHTVYTALEYIVIQGPVHGTLTDESSPTYYQKRYTPNAGFVGADSFTYKVRDPQGLESGVATVRLTVTANAVPVAGTCRAYCPPNTSITKRVPYYDPDTLQTIVVSLVSGAAHGTVTISGKDFVYTPNAGFQGVDTFTYKVNDGFLDSNVGAGFVQVRAPGAPAGALVDLVVDSQLYPELETEILRLKVDLEGEGYTTMLTTLPPVTSAEALWTHLNSVFTGNWLVGALLIGNIAKTAPGGIYSDMFYWNMARFQSDGGAVTSRDIWVGRFYAQDSTYGTEIDLLRHALDANHNYRTGRSRLPHTAYVHVGSDWGGDAQAATEATTAAEVWPDAFVGFNVDGSDVISELSHGNSGGYGAGMSSDLAHRNPVQSRAMFCTSCSSGVFDGVVNQQLLSRGGGNIFSVGATTACWPNNYTIFHDSWPSPPQLPLFRALLKAGELWGHAMLQQFPLLDRDYGTMASDTIVYGDLSLRPLAWPANVVPELVSLVRTPTGVVLVGQPVTFSVSVADSDGNGEKSQHVPFRHQVEWFMNGYDYGRNDPTYTTDDTQGSGWTNVTHVFPSAGTYTIRAEVMDEWRARSWREMTVTVIPAVDSDADGIPDWWMQAHFGHATGQSGDLSLPDQNADGDEMNNLNEYLAGTDPTNRLSVLCLTASDFCAPSSDFVIRWQSASNKYYTVQAATNLLSGFNLNLRTNILATPPENVHTDNVSGAGWKFYRVKLQ